jgi:pimeloyl-ACP methyl ester carboxylesterase
VRIEELRGLCRLLLETSTPKILCGDEELIHSLSSSNREIYGMGHSMGAATVFMAASQPDINITRLLGLDPWMYPLAANFLPGAVPALVLANQNFEWPENDERILRYLEKQTLPPSAFLTIAHGDHADQSDWPVIAPRILRWKMRTPGSIDPEAALEITRQIVLDFMENGRLICPLSEHVICGSRKS